MKRDDRILRYTAALVGVAAAMALAAVPSIASAGNGSQAVERQVVESQIVRSQIVRSQLVRPGLVRRQLGESALVRPAALYPHEASVARLAQIRALSR